MKPFSLIFAFLISVATHAETPSRIYFFDGFFVPIPITSEIRAHGYITEHLIATGANATFVRTHGVHFQKVCEDLRALPVEQRPQKVIFIGHSLGVGAAVQTSRCLEQYPVDLLITIDGEALGMFANDDIIPSNVVTNINFYQTLDLFVRGNKNNRRDDGSPTGIKNIYVDVPLSISPHIQIVDELFERKMILGLIDEVL